MRQLAAYNKNRKETNGLRSRKFAEDDKAENPEGADMADRTRRPHDPRERAEAAFKAATTKPIEPISAKPAVPNAKELVSLRIDRDILDHFQADGPGWQDRINEALRRSMGK